MAKTFLFALAAALAFLVGSPLAVLAVPYIFAAAGLNLAVVLMWLARRLLRTTLGKWFRLLWIQVGFWCSYRTVTTGVAIPRWQNWVCWVLCQLSSHPE